MTPEEYAKSLDDAAWKKAQDVQSWDGMNEVAAPQFIVPSAPYAHVYPTAPEDRKSLEEAIGRYNSQTLTLDDPWAGTILSLNDYFEQGQALPGKLSMGLADSAFKQWHKDAAPSFLDKVVSKGLPIAGALATAGALSPALGSGLTGTTLGSSALGSFAEDVARRALINSGLQLATTGDINLGRALGSSAVGAGVNAVTPNMFDNTVVNAAAKGAIAPLITSGGNLNAAAIGGLTAAGGEYFKDALKPITGPIGEAADNTVKAIKGTIKGAKPGAVAEAVAETPYVPAYSVDSADIVDDTVPAEYDGRAIPGMGDARGTDGYYPYNPDELKYRQYLGNDAPTASDASISRGIYLTPEQLWDAAGLGKFDIPGDPGASYLTPSGLDTSTIRWLDNADTADLSPLQKAVYLDPQDVLTGTRPVDYTLDTLDNTADVTAELDKTKKGDKKTTTKNIDNSLTLSDAESKKLPFLESLLASMSGGESFSPILLALTR